MNRLLSQLFLISALVPITLASAQTPPTFPEGRRVYLTKEHASEIDARLGVKSNEAWKGGKIRVGGKA